MENVLEVFQQFAVGRGAVIDQLSASEAVDLLVSFYREVRMDDCDVDADGDMLLFQWGTYDWGAGRFFEYNITRQVIPMLPDDAEPPEFIGQLSLTFKYAPSAMLEQIEGGNRWCHHPREIDRFLDFISACAATVGIKDLIPVMTELTYGNVE